MDNLDDLAEEEQLMKWFKAEFKPELVFQNFVCTLNLNCLLDLRAIASETINVEYNPDRCLALIMRIKRPKSTGLLFSNGYLFCMGAKSYADILKAARRFARLVQKVGFPVKPHSFTITNIVATCHVNFSINLAALYCSHLFKCTYEPEIFPGLVYRFEERGVTAIIFSSGNVVLTGGKLEKDMYATFDNIYSILLKFMSIN